MKKQYKCRYRTGILDRVGSTPSPIATRVLRNIWPGACCLMRALVLFYRYPSLYTDHNPKPDRLALVWGEDSLYNGEFFVYTGYVHCRWVVGIAVERHKKNRCDTRARIMERKPRLDSTHVWYWTDICLVRRFIGSTVPGTSVLTWSRATSAMHAY